MKILLLDVLGRLLGVRFRVDGIPYGARAPSTANKFTGLHSTHP